MAEDIKTKLERYKTAPFDSRFPNQNQTRNCWQNYLGTDPPPATPVCPPLLGTSWGHRGGSEGHRATRGGSEDREDTMGDPQNPWGHRGWGGRGGRRGQKVTKETPLTQAVGQRDL